jgi:16S rRNA (guanine1516-N2)-methyltransferase
MPIGAVISPERIAVVAIPPRRPVEAERIARSLALPVASGPRDQRFPFLLALTDERLELRQRGPKAPGPITVDFLSGAVAHRRNFGGGRNQALARAVGLRSGVTPPAVLDATAGLGRDAFVLAWLGCRVLMMERAPVVAALLRHGLLRAAADPGLGPIIEQRLSFLAGDSLAYMSAPRNDPPPEVVYLDPMYPARTKSALVKKEMRALQSIVGADDDASQLLTAALHYARCRVVVKRPRLAAPLAGLDSDSAIRTKTTRFDVYHLSPRRGSEQTP